ncbi:histidine triad nucleotide-binding protein [Alkalilacustris brevis]|uniref:histidine triad nucleotide-binding protein n=1 Tax=Alkalilacustris brevis TaxID=2026338 RepID=UPI000E0DE2BF|nr:histidine triad nucleotide-binding protein [Alkalilacustris brevis]
MSYRYDPENIFAKILRGEIPCQKVLETEHSLAFRDIAPQAPHHVLVIPKGAYVCYEHFAAEATDAEILDFTRAIGEVCRIEAISPGAGGAGYRLISNCGTHGMQEVPHLHVHVLGGRVLGRMLTAKREAG